MLAALTASSMVSKIPMSRNGAEAEADDDEVGADALRDKIDFLLAKSSHGALILSILLGAADFPAIHDGHDDRVAGSVLRREGLACRTTRGDQHQLARAGADRIDGHH